MTWPRGLKLACACYLASVSISEPETKTPWVARAPKNKDPLKWYVMACSRLSQVGKWMNTVPDIFYNFVILDYKKYKIISLQKKKIIK